MTEFAERCAVAHPYGQLQLELPGIRPLTVEEELEYLLKQLDDMGAVETDEVLKLTLQLLDIRTLSEKTTRLREITQVQAMYTGQGSWLIPGGVEVNWLCEEAEWAYIGGLPLATLLCCHAACERVLAGCIEASQVRYGELKNWESWGLGKLNAEALKRRVVSEGLNADLNRMNDNRRSTAHFKDALEPTAIWNRLFASRARPDGTVPADGLRAMMDDDALDAYRITMRLLLAPGEGFNSFESLLP